jgi:tetratricopeptide (TPR) repeat protein
VEYRAALQRYDGSVVGEGYDWTVVATDIFSRIHVLQSKAWYVDYKQKRKMVDLLCGFHVTVADIAREHQLRDTEACFNKAIILAREYKLGKQYAYALYRRGLFFEQNGNPEAGSRDFHQALRVKNLPPRLNGLILSAASRGDASCAQYKDEVTEALYMSDDAKQFIGDDIEKDPYDVKFDEERWRLSRAAVYISSPLQECRFAYEALEELERATFPDESRRTAFKEVESAILQAKAHIDKEEYAFVTQLAKDAAKTMREIKSSFRVHDVEVLYTTLKESKYGKSRAVAELGVDLLKVQRPELFPLD